MQKARENEKKAAAKAAEKAKKEEEKKAAGGGAAKAEKIKVGGDEELDPSKYTENRKNFLQNLRDNGKNPYPHKF